MIVKKCTNKIDNEMKLWYIFHIMKYKINLFVQVSIKSHNN